MPVSIRSFLFGRLADGHPTRVDWGLFVLRLGVASLMAFGHGWGKLAGFGEKMNTFADPIGLGPTVSLTLTVFAEFFCSIAVGLGVWTRFAVIPLIINMATAAIIVHSADPWEKKELAVVFLLTYLTLFLTGPGRISVDRTLAKK